MYNIINMYLNSLGFRSITEDEFNLIMHSLDHKRKIETIKLLRNLVKTESTQQIKFEEEIGNNFQIWMIENNLHYIYTEKILGLKEARDIITILQLNLSEI